MSRIPAASIAGVDLARIRKDYPAKAPRIEEIGDRLSLGEESNEEFLELCKLLFDVGENSLSEELLIANMDSGSPEFDLYQKLFGCNAIREFSLSIEAFESQFRVRLTDCYEFRVLEKQCRCTRVSTEVELDQTIEYVLSCEIVSCKFCLSRQDAIECNLVGFEKEDSPTGHGVILWWKPPSWKVET